MMSGVDSDAFDLEGVLEWGPWGALENISFQSKGLGPFALICSPLRGSADGRKTKAEEQ